VNVVGYVNTPIVSGYNLIVNPLSAGISNGANEVFPVLADGTSILTWDPGTAAFTTAIYDTTVGASPDHWYLADGFTPGPIPILSPGKAFFLLPAALGTNTFTGTVVPNPGQTNSLGIVSGYNLVGSPMPVSGAITNTGPNSFNLPLPDGTSILTWDAGSAAFSTAVYDTTVGGTPSHWYLADGFTPGPMPAINVGQGFFLLPVALTPWTQTLAP
jgi:hypothetical protein